MVSFRNTTLSGLGNTSPDYTAIRKEVGKYLHLLQTFYSNTNYVEMQQEQTSMTPHPNLGRLKVKSIVWEFHNYFFRCMFLVSLLFT